ncbi:fluoride efflux transporter CrcB [Pseudalkalibacillus salsuginis]|uniref:fluoride efflux transporter CrcB n=1 Tax=Pseudalkalibacillus salsuginis TaxID=2910972 RepID=UPI001F398FA3|nr:fluoride efflux transporter CrcB [Pseudalkalibacillus salsuginis]MCF6410339.1 fluoride efflux transporter CrcB [Pseudalkalibacillus salsuginis]
MNLLLVMIGGFFGSISRYTLGEWLYMENGFPIGTLSVNLIGCLFLGWFTAFIMKRKKIRLEIPLLIGTGFTGSFTTFSTFSVETVQLIEQQMMLTAITYILISVFAGIGFAYTGYKIAGYKKKKVGGPQ